MKRRRIIPAIAVTLLALCCTANYNVQMQESEKQFYAGNYLEAARTLLPYVNKNDSDQLLFMMEAGLMLHAGGDFKKSNDVLLAASDLSEKIAISVSKTAASLFLNDTVTNYRGEDFERVLIHMYLGINFLMLEKPDEARVEFKKVDIVLRSIKESGGGAYKQNLMAKYLYAVAFELSAVAMKDDNDYNDAYVEYKQIFEKDPGFESVKTDLLRMAKTIGDTEDYQKWRGRFGALDASIPKDAGELILIYQAGQGATKQSRGKLMADVQMKSAVQTSIRGMSLAQGVTMAGIVAALALADNPIPKFVKRSNKGRYATFSADGIGTHSTYMLEDIENTAVKNMEDQYGSMYLKVAAGVAVKAAAAVASGLIAQKIAESAGGNFKKFSGLIGAAAGAGVGAGLASQIKPDLRCWHSLPANLQIKRIFLKPGSYDIALSAVGNEGTVDQKTVKVDIAPGKKTLINYRTLF
jgi:hypothetical protein